MSNLDHDTLRLLLEVFALTIVVGLGIWRIVWLRREERDKPVAAYRFDMRKDGQRFSPQ